MLFSVQVVSWPSFIPPFTVSTHRREQLLQRQRRQLPPACGGRAAQVVHRPAAQLRAQVRGKAGGAEDVAALWEANAASAQEVVEADGTPADALDVCMGDGWKLITVVIYLYMES